MKVSLGRLIFFCLLISISVYAQEVKFMNPSIIDMGEVAQGKILKGKIDFKNTGNKTLEIKSVVPSCGCTAVTPSKMTYKKGETGSIPFSVETKSFKGLIRKKITVNFKNKKPKSEAFFIQAKVITELHVSPTYIDFQQVKLNQDTTLTQFFTVENKSKKDLKITQIKTQSESIQVIPKRITIPAGKSHLIRLKFIPKQTGRQNTSLHIVTDNSYQPELYLPVYIHVKS